MATERKANFLEKSVINGRFPFSSFFFLFLILFSANQELWRTLEKRKKKKEKRDHDVINVQHLQPSN